MSMMKAFFDGSDAYKKKGMSIEDNPYSFETDEHTEWQLGFVTTRREYEIENKRSIGFFNSIRNYFQNYFRKEENSGTQNV